MCRVGVRHGPPLRVGAVNILGWLTGGVIGELTGPLERAYKATLDADTNEKKLAADQAIEFYRGQISLATAAATADKWYSIRSLMGYCALIYVSKIVVWDTVFGLGVTKDPGPQVSGIVMTVIGFYYGSKAATDIAGKLLAAVGPRR